MYILIERGEIYEPYCNITLYKTKDKAIQELKEIAKSIKEEFDACDTKVDEDIDSFYLCIESSCRFIDLTIQEIESNKEICIY